MTRSTDLEFSDAIRCAFEAFRPYANHFRLQKQQDALAPLINYLKSDKEIGAGEKEYLVDLLSGEFGRHRGRPELKLAEKYRRHDICGRVIALETRWRKEGRKRPLHDAAIEQVASLLLQGPRTERATADQIRKWFKALSKEKRNQLERANSQQLFDQINSDK